MCRCWLCVGSGVPGACVCLPRPPGHLLFRLQPMGFLDGDQGQVGQMAREGGRQLLPGVCHGELEESAPCAYRLASSQPCPSCYPPCPTQRPTGTQEEQVQQPGL